RRRASWAAVLAVLALGSLGGALAASWASPPDTPFVEDCAALEGEPAGTWDEARREQLGAAFSAAAARAGAPWILDSELVVAVSLDRWRSRWLASRRALCRARAGGDPLILARHGDCLERHRRVSASLVELFVSEPETLDQAPRVVAELGD